MKDGVVKISRRFFTSASTSTSKVGCLLSVGGSVRTHELTRGNQTEGFRVYRVYGVYGVYGVYRVYSVYRVYRVYRV